MQPAPDNHSVSSSAKPGSADGRNRGGERGPHRTDVRLVGDVVDEPAGDPVAEVGVVGRVQDERVPPDVDQFGGANRLRHPSLTVRSVTAGVHTVELLHARNSAIPARFPLLLRRSWLDSDVLPAIS